MNSFGIFRPCSIGINHFWLFKLVEFLRVLLGENRFRLVWLINLFNQLRAWLKRLKTMGSVPWLVSKHQCSYFASSFLCINCSSVPVVTMKLSTNNYGALLNDDFQNLDMREVSRLLQLQTWPKHGAKYSDSSIDSQCSRTNSSNSSWETTEATSRLFAIFLNLIEEVEEVWKWLCPVTTVCQPKTVGKSVLFGNLNCFNQIRFWLK